jgi:hypothetical protein
MLFKVKKLAYFHGNPFFFPEMVYFHWRFTLSKVQKLVYFQV